jgi:hypothetical protein
MVGAEEMFPETSARKVEARTMSRVVTPKRRFGSYTECFLRTSATMGTVEFTGLEMTRMKAFGQVVAIAVARSRTIPALIWRCKIGCRLRLCVS